MANVVLTPPLTDSDVESLRIGDAVFIDGKMYVARDAAHKKLIELLERGESLPIDLRGQVIYYAGPAPAKPGWVIGPIGPTTSGRMDPYTPRLIAEQGLKAMVGKGNRSKAVKEAIVKHKAVYLATVGGAAALLAKRVKHVQVVAYPELGPEAILELQVEKFPAIVVNDCYGGDLYEEGIRKFMQH